MAKVVNLISKNFKKINPESLDEYIQSGGFSGLKRVLAQPREWVVEELKRSELRGRGGAFFPTGLKWELAAKVPGEDKVVVCNADEGEPCTFKDRYLLEYDPFRIIEGITIAAWAFGANLGYIYIREEYQHLTQRMQRCVDIAKEHGYLGSNILGSELEFNIKVVSGAGAYVCGEETSLMESIEGKSGRPRLRPPYVENGIFGLPTMTNNVETLGAVTTIFEMSPEEFNRYGTAKSRGTKLISLAGNVNRPGAYEVPFGITFREIIYDIGGGIPDNRDLKFLQIGGASGGILPASLIDTPYTIEDLEELGMGIGSGGILVADDTNRIVDFMKSVEDFFLYESCGKCTPCREGNRQLAKIINRFAAGEPKADDLMTVERFARVMKYCSFCGLGKTAPVPLLCALKYFPEEFALRA